MIDRPQMRIACEQYCAFEKRAFGKDERIVNFLIRQQTSLTDFRGDGVNDAMPHRHEIHRLDSPFEGERMKRVLCGGSQLGFVGEFAEVANSSATVGGAIS